MENTEKLAKTKAELLNLHRNNTQGINILNIDKKIQAVRESIKRQESDILENNKTKNDKKS